MTHFLNVLALISVYLEHSLLILTVFHLSGGQVQDSSLHWVLVTVVDEHIWATYYHEVFHPGVRAWLHEAQVSLLRHHRAAEEETMNDQELTETIIILYFIIITVYSFGVVGCDYQRLFLYKEL